MAAVVLAATAATAVSLAAPKVAKKTLPSAVISMIQYNPDEATEVTGSFAFLGTPPEQAFANADTAAEVTASVDLASQDGNELYTVLGVCYELVGSSTISDVTYDYPEFAAPEYSYFAETVSGVVGGLSKGTYYVGVCAEDQSDVYNGAASVTIILTQTKSGVTYDGTPMKPALRSGRQ